VIFVAIVIQRAHERAGFREQIESLEHRAIENARAIVASEADAAELSIALDRVQSEYASLTEESDRLRLDSHPTFVIQGSTGPVASSGCPRPKVIGREPTECPACLLSLGDTGELRAAVVGVQTEGGTTIVRGAMRAVRTEPGPETTILEGPLRLDYTSAAVARSVNQTKPDSFGWGPLFGYGTSGIEAGLIGATRTYDIGIARAEIIGIGRIWQGPKNLEVGANLGLIFRGAR
jgi:hypothetical protein